MSTAINSVEMSYSADEIREHVRAAGVVGAGGAGFPAHVKLQAQVEIFLVNAAECEPMLKVDQQLMWQQAARLVRGVQYAMTATGARRGDCPERKIPPGHRRPYPATARRYPPAYSAGCLSGGR